MEPAHDTPLLVAVRVTELHLKAVGSVVDRILVQHPEQLHVLARVDLDAHVLGHHGREALELLGEDPGGIFRRFGEIRGSAAGVGHGGEQVLIEAFSESDGGRTDGFSCVARESGELFRVGDPHVGEAVGEQQHPSDAVVAGTLGLFQALQPSARQVRHPTGRIAAEWRGGRHRSEM